MKVGELIKMLGEFDPELVVLIDGPEYGLQEPENPMLVEISLNEYPLDDKNMFGGPHSLYHSVNDVQEKTNAVYLERH